MHPLVVPLVSVLASLGIILTGYTPEQYAGVDAVVVQGTLTLPDHPYAVSGTVCDSSVGWWNAYCDVYGASKERPTLILTDSPILPNTAAHELSHALHGPDGPSDDPNNEEAATLAGCRQQYVTICGMGEWWKK